VHTFCGACITEVLQASNRCPCCRAIIIEVQDNRLIAEVVDKFLQTFPEKRRQQSDIDEMDRKYQPGQRILV
jgi:hypothetical protein